MYAEIAKWCGFFLAETIGLSWGTYYVSAPSDVKVLIGVGIILLCALYALWFIGPRALGLYKHLSLVLLVLCLLTMPGCMGCTRIPPGYVGIVVDYYGTDKGVEGLPVYTGMIWYNPFTKAVIEYPTFVQTAVWSASPHEGSKNNEEISFNTKEGMVITGDISLSYQLDATKVPSFYVKFRSDDLDRFTHTFMRNIARDAFNEIGNTYTLEEAYGDKKEELLNRVRDRVNSEVKPFGIALAQFGFIGAPRLPALVVEALNAKIQATQNAIRVENEVRQADAEAKKTIIRANAEAKANTIISNSVTNNLIMWEAIKVWDGKRPMVEGGGSGLIMQLPKVADAH